MVCGRRSFISKRNQLLKEVLFAYVPLFFISFTLFFSLNSGGASAIPLPQAPHNFPVINPQEAAANQDFLVFFVDFQDAKAGTNDFSRFREIFSSPTGSSIYNYFNEVSGGKFTPKFHIVERWYTSEKTMEYYAEDTGLLKKSNCPPEKIDSANNCTSGLLKEVLEQADKEGVPFGAYAHNSNLHIILIHAGENQANPPLLHSSGQSLLHTKWQYLTAPIELNGGIEVRSYSLFSVEDGIAAISHELGHELGLPELYDCDRSSDGVGVWDLMGMQDDLDKPVWLSAWTRTFLNWTEPVIIEKSGIYDVKRGDVFKIKITETEYFLVENRQKTGFDAAIPGSGVLIWHIDDSAQNTDSPLCINDNDNRRRVDLEEAHDLSQDLDISNDGNFANMQNYGEQEDAWYSEPQAMQCKGLESFRLFPRCHSSAFTPSSMPNTNANSGKKTNISIFVTSEPGEIMTVSAVIPEKTPVADYNTEPESAPSPDPKLEINLGEPAIKIPAPSGNLLLSPVSSFLKKSNEKSLYSAAGLIFMIDLAFFAVITRRKGGENK